MFSLELDRLSDTAKAPLKIDKIYAYISLDENGDEGVCAMFMMSEMSWIPMVGADKERMDSLKPIAERLATASRKEITLIEFTGRSILEVIKPKEGTQIEVH